MTILTRPTKPSGTIPSNKVESAQPPKKASTIYFEETYRSAYTHGLEKIYALENVDLKTVKPIQTSSTAQIQQKKTLPKNAFLPSIEQFEFDLGAEYRDWIDSFVLDEPVQVLGLARYTEKCLLDNGKHLLKDLMKCNFRDFVFVKGMGQGHIDEIQQSLNNYLEGKNLSRCNKVDFASWIRTFIGAQDRKKAFICLEMYELSHLIALSPMETMEVRRLTLEKRQEWVQEILVQIKQPEIVASLLKNLRNIVETFFKPWIRKRNGIVTKVELMEYVQRISENPETSTAAIQFFQEVYFSDSDLLTKFLPTIDAQLFYADQFVMEAHKLVIQKAMSYFYRPSVIYKLKELVAWIEREFARNWVGFSEGFVEKALLLSTLFATYKNQQDLLEIRLA